MDSLQDSIRRANSATLRPSASAGRKAPPVASQFMATKVLAFKPTDTVQQVITTLVEKGFSGAPVVDDDGRVAGVISELDCMKVLADTSFHQEAMVIQQRASDLMTPSVISITKDTDLFAVAHKFITTKVRRLPVIEDERLVGLVSRRDLLRAIREFVG